MVEPLIHTGGECEGNLRIFFAFWPPSAAADQLSAWARDAHQLCGGRIMRAETMHLTLAFLGNTPMGKVRELVDAATGWTLPVDSIALRHVGRFFGPRVVWAGPSDSDDERLPWLDQAYDMLWTHLEGMGWQRPASVFRPHVSLLRKAGAGDLASLARPPVVWTPAQALLVASRPREGGSFYDVLARLPLRPLDAG
ncbi:MAG TPA: RNA 2',3'-cyclic phosphodiesterase [Candidimonas sp.]|nr:RNA 2',3'-cyclic phosphodiesterase [Candidimonas sp.]